jgi:anti-sigma B factor antagonist
MIIEIEKDVEKTIVKVVGRLDANSAPSLEKVIKEDIGEPKNLIVDCKGLEYVSSAGLRVLLGAQKKMNLIGEMKVINVCESVMDVFEMTGFADILTIE